MNEHNKKNIIIFYLKIIIILLFFIQYLYIKNILKNELLKIEYNNNYSLRKIFKNIDIQDDIFFNFTNIILFSSYKFNISELRYNINFYDKNNMLIKPSDLTLFYNLHVVCYAKIQNKIYIESLANIIQNKELNCIEYFNLKEKISFGIKIYNKEFESIIINCSINTINTNNKFINDIRFNPFLINKEYQNLKNMINKIDKYPYLKLNKLNLKKNYIDKPICLSNIYSSNNDNKWQYKNIYNNYFCFCKGNCLYKEMPQKCKYFFYLKIIDDNKLLYNKTDYLFSDFYGSQRSSDDTYPIFVEMIKQNISAHYMDEKIDIYNKFCSNEIKCLKIVPVINGHINIDGNFLEKYLELILKLKAVIAGESFYSFINIFYDIDYITYINLGHGIKFFKQSSYIQYVSPKSFNKLVLPPSNKIISVAKKYGWKDNDIIKNCLPRWDKYDLYKKRLSLIPEDSKLNNSIFVMFTWRMLNNKNYNMEKFYLGNILKFLNNKDLIKELKTNKIFLYFTLHSIFHNYKNLISINKYIKYITQRNISNCLMKSKLLITDFSSIIFDMIYQYKPYIMFIPDADDPNIKHNYNKGYYEIIDSLKNGTLYFQNKFFTINETINKTISYINNNFKIEPYMKKFYDEFEFNCKNNTKSFINYLINIK